MAMRVFAAVDIGREFSLRSGGIAQVFPTFGHFFSTLLFNVYAIAGIILIFLLIFGGIGVIIGAGGKDAAKLEQGKKTITIAIVGFIIIFASYFIVQIIQVLTGTNVLNPGF